MMKILETTKEKTKSSWENAAYASNFITTSQIEKFCYFIRQFSWIQWFIWSLSILVT
jgi:hypothetical protein